MKGQRRSGLKKQGQYRGNRSRARAMMSTSCSHWRDSEKSTIGCEKIRGFGLRDDLREPGVGCVAGAVSRLVLARPKARTRAFRIPDAGGDAHHVSISRQRVRYIWCAPRINASWRVLLIPSSIERSRFFQVPSGDRVRQRCVSSQEGRTPTDLASGSEASMFGGSLSGIHTSMYKFVPGRNQRGTQWIQ